MKIGIEKEGKKERQSRMRLGEKEATNRNEIGRKVTNKTRRGLLTGDPLCTSAHIFLLVVLCSICVREFVYVDLLPFAISQTSG